MSIFTYNDQFINILAPFTDPVTGEHGINLTIPANREKYGIVEHAEPAAPEDYSPDLYYRTEQMTAPFVVYTRKPDEQIAQIRRDKAMAEIRALEEQQIREMARMNREQTLAAAEQLALEQFQMTPEQLYIAGSAEGAPIAAINYKKLKDIDNAIKAVRESIA